MTDNIDPKIENIKNTFIPSIDNERLSIYGIITCLQRGFVKFNSLPEDVKENVKIILEKRLQESNAKPMSSFSKDILEEMK